MKRRSRGKAFSLYMRDELRVLDMTDEERRYIIQRLGRGLRLFRRPFVWLDRRMEKLLYIVKVDLIIQDAEREEEEHGGLSA